MNFVEACATSTIQTSNQWLRRANSDRRQTLPPNELRIVSHLKFSHCDEPIEEKQTLSTSIRICQFSRTVVDSVQLKIKLKEKQNCDLEFRLKMEVDDEEMDGSTGTDQMAVSKSLISCFQAVMEQKSVAKIEHVFKMITNNLTYDDPGMFIKSLIRDERNRQIQDTTVMWLLNQVISLSNKFELYR